MLIKSMLISTAIIFFAFIALGAYLSVNVESLINKDLREDDE